MEIGLFFIKNHLLDHVKAVIHTNPFKMFNTGPQSSQHPMRQLEIN